MSFSIKSMINKKSSRADFRRSVLSGRRPAGDVGYDALESLVSAAKALKGSRLSDSAYIRCKADLANLMDFFSLASEADAVLLAAVYACCSKSCLGAVSLSCVASHLGYSDAMDAAFLALAATRLVDAGVAEHVGDGRFFAGGELSLTDEFLDCVSSNCRMERERMSLKRVLDEALAASGKGRNWSDDDKEDGLDRIAAVEESASIRRKRLVYTGRTGEALEPLFRALSAERLSGVQERMRERGLSAGVCALFYGAPGTGKTETVRQIAASTGRDLVCVDMSRMRGRKVGSTQRAARAVFDFYEAEMADAERAGRPIPILLLNEADGVFSSRRDGAGGANACIEDEENTARGVILDRMERFEGVMVATTNLEKCFDSAFDRRFLFKVEFERPGVDERAALMKEKIGGLSDEDSLALASRWDLSGGEIDNVARKCVIKTVLSGAAPTARDVEGMMKGERISRSWSRECGFGSSL